MTASFGCIVLTQGKRPEQLKNAINSILGQSNVETDLVVVGNGYDPAQLTDQKTVFLKENLGIPAGRNAGVKSVSGEYLLFLDDDVVLTDQDFLEQAARYFKENSKVGLIQPKPKDPTGLEIPRRWVPRVWVRDPDKSSKAFSLWEGATLVRSQSFESAGGWPSDFFYGHEGVALVWKVWDIGQVCEYQANLEVTHPLVEPSERHADFYFYNARNRYWLAARYLPFGFSQCYRFNWYWLMRFRLRNNPAAWHSWLKGWNQGKSDVIKNKLKYRTIFRMLRWGRLLII